MLENLKFAWRNIWRNKKRTLITIASVFFAMFFALIMNAAVKGTWDQIIEGVNESYTGYIQIQGADYFKSPVIDNSLPYISEIDSIVNSEPNVKNTVFRLESYGLASIGEQSKFAAIIGVDPEKEDIATKLSQKIAKIYLSEEALAKIETEISDKDLIAKLKRNSKTYFSSIENLKFELTLDKNQEEFLPIIEKFAKYEGDYLDKDTNGVLIGGGMAKYFNIGVGDSIIIYGQGYHGASAAGIYPILGIVDLPGPEFNKSTIYMQIKTAQELFSAFEISENGDSIPLISYLAINVKNTSKEVIEKNTENFNNKLDENYKSYTWREFNVELKQMYEGKVASGKVMSFILYIIVAFGVFGTVLMMTTERRREFGIMIAIGMNARKLRRIVTLETTILGLLGCVVGVAFTLPVILLGHYNPIVVGGSMKEAFSSFNLESVLKFAGIESYILSNIFIVMILIILASFLPIFKIGRFKVINAIKGK